MVFTVRRARPATSELGTPTPKVFSRPTTSSRALIGPKPRPFGPKTGRSSPIWSAVTWSIRFLTSISLMRGRRSPSDIVKAPDSVALRGARQTPWDLDLIGLFAGIDRLVGIRLSGGRRILRHRRLRGVALCRGIALSSLVEFVAK